MISSSFHYNLAQAKTVHIKLVPKKLLFPNTVDVQSKTLPSIAKDNHLAKDINFISFVKND